MLPTLWRCLNTDFRFGRNVSIVGDYNVSRNRGHTRSGLTAALVAGGEHPAKFTEESKQIVINVKHPGSNRETSASP